LDSLNFLFLKEVAHDDEQNKDEKKESFTEVSYLKKIQMARPTTGPVLMHATAKSNDRILLTLSNFSNLHYRIFPIVETIAANPGFQADSSVQKWKKFTTTSTPKVTATRKFCVIVNALVIGATDIYGYHTFIQSSPSLTNIYS
jgi:hypothetical protein